MDSQPHAKFTTAEAACPCFKYSLTPTALRAEAPCLMNFVEGYREEVINPLMIRWANSINQPNVREKGN